MTTFNLSSEQHVRKFNETAFSGCGVIKISVDDLFKMISNDVYQSLQTFPTRKEASEFCEQWGFRKTDLTRINTRFEISWIIGLGRGTYVPANAIGHLMAYHMSRKLVSVEA